MLHYYQRFEMTGKEIKELRKKLKMTQQELADELGVARITVVRWEAEQKHPSRLAKRRLARVANDARE